MYDSTIVGIFKIILKRNDLQIIICHQIFISVSNSFVWSPKSKNLIIRFQKFLNVKQYHIYLSFTNIQL